VVVPATIGGVAVKHLEAGCFEGSPVERVIISPGIDCIRSRTFANCPQLKQITIPDSVVWIVDDAFRGRDDKLLIICGSNSEAFRFSGRNGIQVQVEDEIEEENEA